MSTILITGAHGFIAGILAAHFHTNGWRVVGTARREDGAPHFDAVHRCALGESLRDLLARERVDAVVHAAYYAGPDEYRVNVEGTRRWLDETRGLAHVFLSSLSATGAELSDYARAKRDLESSFQEANAVVLRLGLVVGAGGLFGRMMESVRRSPVVPLLDNGVTPVYLVDPRFLAATVARSLSADASALRGRAWHVHEPASYTLRDVLLAVRRATGARCRFVAVPSLPALWALTIAGRVAGKRLPINATNVRGLRAARRQSVATDFVQLGGVPRSLDELVADAVRDAQARRAR